MKWLLAVFVALSAQAVFAAEAITIYDLDPNHLWNRLNEALFLRTAPDGKRFGANELDILFWNSTKHLLTGSSHQKAVAVLDEFIKTHGERLIRDPLKKAWLQHDLWELFDWSADPNRDTDQARACRELQTRLAEVIRRVALTPNEISTLPDNYARSATENLPHGLLQTNGDWLVVRDENDSLTAPTHVSSFDGHSAFTVHLRLPGGAAAAQDYLKSLRAFARTNHLWTYRTNRFLWANTNEPEELLELSAAIPQFPTNTDWALVRQMLLIDTEGNLQPSRVVESIQVRRYFSLARPVYVTVTNENGYQVAMEVPRQNFYEFQLNRRDGGRLREIGKHERGFTFVHFMGKGIDLLELDSGSEPPRQAERDSSRLQSVILGTCMQCHSAKGIFSVNSYTRSLSFSMSSQRPANLFEDKSDRDTAEAVSWKQRQFDWGLLQGLWMNRL